MLYKSKFLFYFLPLCHYQETWVWREKGNDFGHHGQPSMDGGWGITSGDFCGEGRGTCTRFATVEGAGVVVGGGESGWTEGGNLCCISMFMLKSTKSLKDLSEESSVFLIGRLISMLLARNISFIVFSQVGLLKM